MYKIDIKDVIDFCWCPRYYDIKKQSPDSKNIKQMYDEALHDTFYVYLYALQNDVLAAPISLLKQTWGKKWVKRKKNSQIICTPSASKRDYYDNKRKTGIDAIITFNDMISKDKQFPIIINTPYSLKITDNIILTGVWEYIREIGNEDNKSIQIIKFRTESNRFQTTNASLHDLELTAASMAFRETFNADTYNLIYMDICKKKMTASTRTIADYRMLKHAVVSTVACLKHNIRCVSPDNKCYHCEYRNVCQIKLASNVKE